MKLLPTSTVGIEQGEDVLFSDFEDDGEMWTGEGPRERRKKIKFAKPFHGTPNVFVSLTMWDFDNAANARASVEAAAIKETGFDVLFRTWGDTRVARAKVSWMAIGAVQNEDDWQL